jgi:FkbM family methyltransferase
MSKLVRLLSVLEWHGAFRALISWPKFSLASFVIVSRLKRAGASPKTVIDIGANVGQFAVAASRLFADAHVCSIEPDSRTATRLRNNLKSEQNANVLVTAVGDYVGEVVFHVNNDSQVSSMLALGQDRVSAFPQSKVVEEISVPISTLDALFIQHQFEKPILVKIDVQGAEDKVIRGSGKFLQDVDWVLMEVTFADLYEGEMDFQNISNLMAESGFKFVRPLNFHVSPLTGEIIEMDALFWREPIRR